VNSKIKKNTYKLLFPAAFLIVCAFCSAQVANANDEAPTKYGVVFDDTNGVGTPNYARIIKKDGVYHMWYEDSALEEMFHATSNDGRHWTAGQITNIANVHEPSIIWDSADSKYKLWFEPTTEGLEGQIWYSQSDDGLTWDASQALVWTDGDHPWEDDGRYMPNVIKESGTYKMWYQSLSSAPGEGGDRRINYATSVDGVNWDNSGEFHCVTFAGNGDNNMVLGLRDGDSWDSVSLYSQTVIRLSENADWNYLMFYAAHDGGRYKIGRAVSDDGISWTTESDYLISEEHDIWFPSVTEELSEHYIWYMDSAGGKVYFATVPFGGTAQSADDNNSEPEKAYIDSWKAYQYKNANKNCSSRLRLTIKGKHFDKDTEVRIGDRKASSIDRKSSKKIVAKFCLDRLLDNQASHKRTVSVTNPDTAREEADKKIDLDDISYQITADNPDTQSAEGIKNIQTALSQMGLLGNQYITGIYGAITTEAVRNFQEQNDLPPTGFFGPLTTAKLREKMK